MWEHVWLYSILSCTIGNMKNKSSNGSSHPFPTASGDVEDSHYPHVLGRDGKPDAVVIPYTTYRRLQEAQKDQILAQFDRLLERLGEQNAACAEEDVAADVEMARGG
jgi:PHD/YefM family antitoxin component YafN of YafNO toxin-antitoxin module